MLPLLLTGYWRYISAYFSLVTQILKFKFVGKCSQNRLFKIYFWWESFGDMRFDNCQGTSPRRTLDRMAVKTKVSVLVILDTWKHSGLHQKIIKLQRVTQARVVKLRVNRVKRDILCWRQTKKPCRITSWTLKLLQFFSCKSAHYLFYTSFPCIINFKLITGQKMFNFWKIEYLAILLYNLLSKNTKFSVVSRKLFRKFIKTKYQ